ncbi:MAG TPA: type II toxin-antitoxin system HipA family toxin [Solirubrobacteraceae bacterium]|jgi:serine/threonine-protein kinase HipA|nr:type II toxin-antitoxin system HipA family toxin [Solirubrobacteraceae bacterium]
MADRTLEVWCFDVRAGMLGDCADGLDFVYDDSWLTADRPALSQSLPLDGSYSKVSVAAFFGGLLPEGVPRGSLARNLGVSAANDFGLLQALGGDTAGAISLLPAGDTPRSVGGEVEWLEEHDLAELVDDLPNRPMHADDAGEYRLSLAGAQDKLPVVVGADRRIGLTKGGTPSTHILKTAIAGLDGTVFNEALCLAIGRRLGIETVATEPCRVEGRDFLLVERYDRVHDEHGVRRLHQEDFCQALGVSARAKYQNEGGPGLADCFALLRRATAVPAREALKLLDQVALSFLVGNHDAHGKNYSLLYLADSSKGELSPAYDVLSTIAYEKTRPMSRKMAMSIGGEYRPDYVSARHLDRLLGEAGLGAAAARRRLREVAQNAPPAAREAHEASIAGGWDAPVLARIVEIVDRRAGMLEELTAPVSAPRRKAAQA